MDKKLSETIDLLRFPLAIMVIFIHSSIPVVNLLDADFPVLSGQGILNVIGIVMSHILTHIAVPTFFLISGFLFFVNFQDWSWNGYKKKMQSRVKTLLIPYLSWNTLVLVFVVIGLLGSAMHHHTSLDKLQEFLLNNNWHVYYDCHEWGTERINWLGQHLRMTGPIDLPLWFLRDLIFVSILSPVIYFAVRKLKILALAILFLAYISRVWTLIPGFHITAFFFYTLGAYIALNKKNIIDFVTKYRWGIIPSYILLLIVTTIYNGVNTTIGQNIYPFFIITGVFTAFYIASVCVIKWNLKPNKLLVSSCFFIYAAHAVGVPGIGSSISISRKIIHLIIPGSTLLEDAICYLATPFMAAGICILVLMIGRRLFPKLTLLFSGNK